MKKILHFLMIAGIAVSMTACGSNQQTKAEKKAMSQADAKEMMYFEAHQHGRINVFDDAKTYMSFLQLGETSYRLTRIGAGPKGQTVVFGLTKQDKKKRSGIKSIDMYDGKLVPSGKFYGEMVVHDRFYVFNNWNDLKAVQQTGEAAYRYTQIGAGPNGKTVVFVLNKSNKKKKPVDLIASFKKLHNL